ncbi:ring-hydroxylating oxygenase subunit alpha [Streptomyces hiroshimensis]|uniref:Ring-hydroxylating oxygenase subunit alpha n=1 Tax=Streptomyces hiroshimensis TaxID=66424 RepID=A0ABQ2YLG6_9ACTN|nr:ring-hydroxylating oxygenase subunit alpha [Streptomyces hiroshimensis]
MTEVGPGTPMGELLRRYWHPVAPAMELRERRVKPVKLLGEDLLLFRKQDGGHGLISRHCPHRRADLALGWVDGDALRCAYHGWAFDASGRCVSQPFEEAGPSGGFRDKVRTASYPTATLGGLVWAYLGPDPAPLLPDFEPFSWSHGFVEVIMTELPCNWFQCHENGVDPVHFEWLHSNGNVVRGNPDARDYVATHLDIEFLEFAYGFVNGRVVDTVNAPKGEYARTSNVADGGILCLWPYTLVSGSTIEFRVPVDERRTLNITWQYSVLPDDAPTGEQGSDTVPYWYGPYTDPATGDVIMSHTLNQDFATWAGQGAVTDRTREQLGRSDAGITMLRRRYFEAMEQVARGEDPPGTVRDPEANVRIQLPIHSKSYYTEGMPRAVFEEKLAARKRSGLFGIGGFHSVQAGRPEHLQAKYEEIAGIAE